MTYKGSCECVRDFSFNPELVFVRIDSIHVHKKRSNLLEPLSSSSSASSASSVSSATPFYHGHYRNSRFDTIYENSIEVAENDDADSVNSDEEHKENCFDFVSLVCLVIVFFFFLSFKSAFVNFLPMIFMCLQKTMMRSELTACDKLFFLDLLYFL